MVVEKRKVRVVLADDHARVRAAVRTLLEHSSDITVVGEAGNGLQALELVDLLQPDVLLLDMEMPVMNGSQVAAHLREKNSPVRILALSAYDDQQYILGMLEGGASGYLTKDEAPENVVAAVRGVAAGQQGWVSRRVAEKMASWKKKQGPDRVTLTQRELDILHMAAQRTSLDDMAERLKIDQALVQKHLDILCAKLKARSPLELFVRAQQENLI